MVRGLVGRSFGLLGAFVGKYPLICVLICVVVSLPGFIGLLLRFQADLSLNKGFISDDAPSHREIAYQRAFFDAQGEPWYLALFGLSRDSKDGNMLNDDEFAELNDFYTYVTQQLTLSLDEDEVEIRNGSFKYTDICRPLCNINDIMQKLMSFSWAAVMKYPVSHVGGYDLNIGKHIFERTIDSKNMLTRSKFIAYYFTVFAKEKLTLEKLALFEETVGRLAIEHNQNENNKVELIAHGSNHVMSEMKRGGEESMVFIVFGHCLAIVAFVGLNFISAWLHNQFPVRRLLLAVLAVVLVIISIFVGIGWLSLFGSPISLLFITSPIFTLILIISAHGVFHITDSWSRLQKESKRKRFSASERLGATFEQIAPSFLVSNLSLICAFFVAHFFLAHNYSVFSLGLSLALAFNFLYQIFLFSASLARTCGNGTKNYEELYEKSIQTQRPSIQYPLIRDPATKIENGNTAKNGASNSKLSAIEKLNKKTTKNCQRRQFRMIFSQYLFGFGPYSKFLSSASARLILVGVVVLFAWGVITGFQRLENRMDYRRMLPAGSPSIRAFNLMDNVWNDNLQIVYIVKKAPNFENATEVQEFKRFVFDAGNIDNAMESRAHMSWIFDYFRDQFNDNFFHMNPDRTEEAVNMTLFKDFISSFPYDAWKSGTHYHFEKDGKVKIDEMLVMIAYNGTKGLSDKLRLMTDCREVAAKYPMFDIVAFDTDSETVDIIAAVPSTGLIFIIALIGSVGVTTQLLLWDLPASVLNTIGVASIIAAICGLGHFVGLEVDLQTMPATATIVAPSLHLGLQFVGEFISCWAKDDRLKRSLEFTSSPLWKTAFIWMVLAVPQLLSPVEFFLLQAHLLILGVVLALFHALFLLPVIVGILHTKLYAKN